MSEPQSNKRKGITFGRVVSAVGTTQIDDAPFPTLRTLRWFPQGLPEAPAGAEDAAGNVAFVVTQEVLLATNRHVAQTLDKELGGFLLGNRYQCPNTGRNYVIIDQYMKANYTEGTEVSLKFTNESWAQLNDQMTGKFRGKLLVGWYHSHPRMNVFLSAHDVTFHETRFADSWKVALVLEPAKHLGGFFAWTDGKLDPHNCVEFYELLEGESRESVVAWINYVGNDPTTKARPVLKALNTMTALAASTITLPAEGLKKAMSGVTAPPAPKVLRVILPPWLGRARLWIGLGVLAILAFILTFAVANWLSRSPEKEAVVMNEPAASETPAVTRPATNALDALEVDVTGKPQVNTETGRFTVDLIVRDVPKDIVEDVQAGLEVKIDGLLAETRNVNRGTGSFVISAVTELRDKIEALRRGAKQRVQLKASFVYGDDGVVFDIPISVNPFKGNAPVVNVSFEREKAKKSTRQVKNASNGSPKQPSPPAVRLPDATEGGRRQNTFIPDDVPGVVIESETPTIKTETSKRRSEQNERDAERTNDRERANTNKPVRGKPNTRSRN